MWESLRRFLITCIWAALNVHANRTNILLKKQKYSNRESPPEQLKSNLGRHPTRTRSLAWPSDMEGHARKCVERYRELANKTVEQLQKISTPSLDDHQFKNEELEMVVELSIVCSQIILKCLYLAHTGRPHILCSVNKLARAVTKCTRACDRHMARVESNVRSYRLDVQETNFSLTQFY